MFDLHGISQASCNVIIASEISSQSVYVRKYQRPEWPGEQSGATIGIGYDIGQNSRAQFRDDWNGKLPESVLAALEKACGITGAAAQAVTAKLRQMPRVVVPWDAAIDVFSNHDIPRYMAMCRAALPGFDDLPPDCKGVILSICFNRGPSFRKAGPRYNEMRAIRACMVSGNLAGIPAQIRSMKRLWPDSRGLRDRRDVEAALFAKGVVSQRASLMSSALDEDTGRPVNERATDDFDAIDDADDTAAAQEDAAPEVITDKETIATAQSRLRALGYYDIGKADGEVHSRSEGAILAFRNEHGLPLRTTIDNDFLTELAKASPRKIGEERATATAADLRDEGSKTIGMTDRFKKWGGRLFGIGSGGAMGTGILATLTDRLSAVSGVKEAVGGLGLSVHAVIIIIAIVAVLAVLTGTGLLVWFIADKIEKNRVADYRTGKNT